MYTIRVPYSVPYAAQVASPELAEGIFDGGSDPRLDPRWRESGAVSPEEYAYWTGRACGAACVKMCVEALGGRRCGLVEWARAGVELGGYLVVEHQDGSTTEKGWTHKALAELIRNEGFQAEPQPADLNGILEHLLAGRMVIASVSFEIGTHREITHSGGHLVVISGAEIEDEEIKSLIIHNPSGRRGELREGARIPRERFRHAFNGRIITVGKRGSLPYGANWGGGK